MSEAEFNASEASEPSFDEVLGALKNVDEPFAARYLYRLSGLEKQELADFAALWPQLPAQRRLGLLQDMELMAEGNTVLHFDTIHRLALDDEDSQVRTTAIRSLWPSEQSSLASKFMQILQKDQDLAVRSQAAAALGRFVYLGEVGKVPPGTLKEIEARLLDVLNADEDPEIQQRALESLGYSGRPEVAERIEQAYESDEEDWIVSSLLAMGRSADDRWGHSVIESLNNPNSDISKEAARAAGELELSEARPGLFDLLQDEDSEIRLAAAWSLSQIGGNGVSDVLEELLEQTEDEDEIDLLQNALENLAFTEELEELNLLDFSPEDLEDFAKPNQTDDSETED
jgi:HEAT repeat protein